MMNRYLFGVCVAAVLLPALAADRDHGPAKIQDTRLAVNYEFRDDKAHPALGNLALAQYQISF